MTAPIKVKLLGIVGFLAAVEIASGTLQGFYTPIVPQITQHLSISTAGANWFEAAQLVVSALIVPVLAVPSLRLSPPGESPWHRTSKPSWWRGRCKGSSPCGCHLR